MNPVPLAELRLRPRHHLSALWWLALLYRRPRVFQRDLEQLGRGQRIRGGDPHVPAWFAVCGRHCGVGAAPGVWCLRDRVEHAQADLDVGSLVSFHVVQIATGIALGIAFGIALGIAFGITLGIAGGIAGGIGSGIGGGIALALGIAGGIAGGIAVGIALGIAVGIGGGIAGGIAHGIGGGIGGGIVGGIAGGIGFGIAGGIVGGIGGGIAGGIAGTRAYYLLPHLFFVWPRLRGAAYLRHPVAWDDLCGIPFPGLCRLLADYSRV